MRDCACESSQHTTHSCRPQWLRDVLWETRWHSAGVVCLSPRTLGPIAPHGTRRRPLAQGLYPSPSTKRCADLTVHVVRGPPSNCGRRPNSLSSRDIEPAFAQESDERHAELACQRYGEATRSRYGTDDWNRGDKRLLRDVTDTSEPRSHLLLRGA
jgi:hypothetical protein